jgi:hypothetical protein
VTAHGPGAQPPTQSGPHRSASPLIPIPTRARTSTLRGYVTGHGVSLGPSGPLRTVAKGAVPPVTSVLVVTAVTLPIVTPQGGHGPTTAAVIVRGPCLPWDPPFSGRAGSCWSRPTRCALRARRAAPAAVTAITAPAVCLCLS